MRRTLVLPAVVLVASLVPSSPSLAQSPEDGALNAVVRAQTLAFYAGDETAWQAVWLHDPKASRTTVANGGWFSATGWDRIAAQMAEIFKSMPKPSPPVELTIDKFIVHMNGPVAAVQYDQTIKTSGTTIHSQQHRVLVKQGADWKVISQVSIDSDSFNTVEAGLNGNGYQLLEAKKLKEAIELFKLVVQFYPQSWNAYDSLGEAYAVAGNKALAIENYEKSIQLNPKNESGKAALAKLKQ
jgi:tetratricopeptide (TPR) repeat protein